MGGKVLPEADKAVVDWCDEAKAAGRKGEELQCEGAERRRLKDESERLQRVIDGEVAQIRRHDVSCDTEVE